MNINDLIKNFRVATESDAMRLFNLISGPRINEVYVRILGAATIVPFTQYAKGPFTFASEGTHCYIKGKDAKTGEDRELCIVDDKKGDMPGVVLVRSPDQNWPPNCPPEQPFRIYIPNDA